MSRCANASVSVKFGFPIAMSQGHPCSAGVAYSRSTLPRSNAMAATTATAAAPAAIACRGAKPRPSRPRSSAKCVPSVEIERRAGLGFPPCDCRSTPSAVRRDTRTVAAGERGGDHDQTAQHRADGEHRQVERDPGVQLELMTDSDRKAARECDRDHGGEQHPSDSNRHVPQRGRAAELPARVSQRTQRGPVAVVPALLGPDQDPCRGSRPRSPRRCRARATQSSPRRQGSRARCAGH